MHILNLLVVSSEQAATGRNTLAKKKLFSSLSNPDIFASGAGETKNPAEKMILHASGVSSDLPRFFVHYKVKQRKLSMKYEL